MIVVTMMVLTFSMMIELISILIKATVISKKWWSDRYDGGYDDNDNHDHDNINTSN